MNRDDYRRAVDALPFSTDFQERTEALVRQQAQSKKECIVMKKRGLVRAVAIAAAVALFTVSAYAASRWLSPAQVAEQHRDPMLAQAFESEDAIRLDQSVQTENFCVTLAGLVSGENLSSWTSQADQARTYAVMILESLDGTPLNREDFPLADYTFTPLVYLAFYQGTAPDRDTFTMAEDGTISFVNGFEGPRALFTLPLDAGKADPAAVERFMDESGFDREWFTTVQPDDGETHDVQMIETETKDGLHVEILPGDKDSSGSQS